MSIVLIASAERLPAIREQDDLKSASAFADTDALRALETVIRQRPAVVALDQPFAASARGTALINRIKADPALAACEIRVLQGDAPVMPVQRRPTDMVAGTPGAAAAVEAPPAQKTPLDQRGTRRSPRFRIVEGVELLVDGNPATLIDLSTIGAQIVSPTILKPNQRIRVLLPAPSKPIRFTAAVAWAAFEIPRGGPRYRAGLMFFDANEEAVGLFIASHKRT